MPIVPSSLPALPNASAITPAELAVAGRQVEEWAAGCDDPLQVRDLADRWSAITEYVRRKSRDGVAEAEAVLRRLEVRVGVLLGRAPEPGRPTSEMSVMTDISKHHRSDFRDMANHADIVEQVIAESDDVNPPSRRKVLGAIRDHKQRDAVQTEHQLLQAEIETRGLNRMDPAEIAHRRRATEILGALDGALSDLLACRDQYGIDEYDRFADDDLWAFTVQQSREAVQFLTAIVALRKV